MFDFNEYPQQQSTQEQPDQIFLSAMAGHGFNPERIIADGKLHRFDIEKKDQAGWYVFYSDNIAAGSFGDWRTGSKIKWCAKAENELSDEQLQQFRDRIEQARIQREQERDQATARARLKAAKIWQAAAPAWEGHAYLKKKSAKAYGIRQDTEGCLIIPVYDMFGELQTIERIFPDGKKRFLPDGEKRGNYFTISATDPSNKSVCICEGYATGASIHEATGATVIIAFDAGNLLPVAENVKSKYSHRAIVICADNDQWTTYHDGRPNPGIVCAQAAAEAINARIVYPEFKDLTSKPTDFNDLAQAEGLDTVRNRIRGRPMRFSIIDWGVQVYAGEAPERTWLIKNTFPLATVCLLAAMGDAGKGLLGMDLAVKVAAGPNQLNLLDPHTAFGNSIIGQGKAVIFTAEDDKSEVHRRFSAICNTASRLICKDKLFIIPLPNAGGPVPLVTPGRHGPETSPVYHEIKEQLLDMEDLKLIMFDPLASFVTADVNADPAVGAYVNGLLSNLATETGATILIAHHMSKSYASREIYTAEQARSLIRGTTAIVDGVRAAYVLWPAARNRAQRVCKIINQAWTPNQVFFGALVKANGPGDREIKTFIRDMNTGLLKVWDDILNKITPTKDMLLQFLIMDIAQAAANGRPFTKTGATGIYERREELDKRLREMGRNRLEEMVQELLDGKEIVKCIAAGSRATKWLDVTDGPYYRGTGEIGIGGIGVNKK